MAEINIALIGYKFMGKGHSHAFRQVIMHTYPKIPAVPFAKKLVEDGKIGTPCHYHGAYLQDWIMDPNFPLVWRLEKKFAGSGALGDIGAHAIDFARLLNGEFDS